MMCPVCDVWISRADTGRPPASCRACASTWSAIIQRNRRALRRTRSQVGQAVLALGVLSPELAAELDRVLRRIETAGTQPRAAQIREARRAASPGPVPAG